MRRTDQTLLRRLRRGDKGALAEIYGAHKDCLFNLAYRLLDERAAAEDCLHDVFLKLVRDAVNLRIRGNLRAYLSSCVLNRARDELRRSNRHVQVPLSGGPEGCDAGVEPSPRLEAMDLRARIQSALALLPREQREAVALHLHGGLTFRQIGASQSISINTARSRYRYGIQRLRDLLTRQEER